jgi:aminoglycoside phosphotransferase (APT) family kinase protein
LVPTAHDVEREHRFLAALYGRARVPRPLVYCDDTSIIGAPFYLMERTEGVVIRTEIPGAYDTPEGRRRINEEQIDALVELHAVDWKAAGLKGRGDDYVERQVKRWSSQWELTRPRTRQLAGLDRLTDWLRGHMPPQIPATVVHGDYKLDNVMFAADEPKLLAIFDWEMATIGDPLADLGYFINGLIPEATPPGFEDRPVLRSPMMDRPGWMTPDELAARYEAKSGRSMKDLLFYRVLARYKLIIILEGLYMHYIEGSAANPGAADFEWRVPMMVASAQQLIDREGN